MEILTAIRLCFYNFSYNLLAATSTAAHGLPNYLSFHLIVRARQVSSRLRLMKGLKIA
jgi:hypothetical protein